MERGARARVMTFLALAGALGLVLAALMWALTWEPPPVAVSPATRAVREASQDLQAHAEALPLSGPVAILILQVPGVAQAGTLALVGDSVFYQGTLPLGRSAEALVREMQRYARHPPDGAQAPDPVLPLSPK